MVQLFLWKTKLDFMQEINEPMVFEQNYMKRLKGIIGTTIKIEDGQWNAN